MFKITKEFHFSAAHHLHGLPDGHQCARIHEHNYVVKVELSSDTLDENGFVQDYGALKEIKEYIDTHLDHKDLNVMVIQPTAEHIARILFWEFKKMYPLLTAIEISETPKTNCRYEPTDN